MYVCMYIYVIAALEQRKLFVVSCSLHNVTSRNIKVSYETFRRGIWDVNAYTLFYFKSQWWRSYIGLRMRLIMITGWDTGTSGAGNDDIVVYF